MIIPERLRKFNFVLISKDDGKKPFEKSWQNKLHNYDDIRLIEHINNGYNYGVQCNNSYITIDGNLKFLVIIDFDSKEFQDKVINLFPETFTTTSGSKKNCYHLWFASDSNESFKVLNEKMETLADIQGKGKQVVAPGSKHKSGSIYSIVKDIDFAYIPYSEIKAILKPFDKTPEKQKKEIKQYIPKDVGEDITEKILNSVSMKDVLSEIGIDTSKNPTNCFSHSSSGGKCFGWDEEKAHCFHCDGSWNKFSLIRDAKKLNSKQTFEWFAEKSNLSEELKKSRYEYAKKNKEIVTSNNFINAVKVFGTESQVNRFNELQPIFFDKSGLFWLWNKEKLCWEITDEIDLLNIINEYNGSNIIESKARTELINSLKQNGRRNIPLDIKENWIQFENKIFDVKSGESFEASSKYFVTNPIPWKVSNKTDTPVMDKIFEEWVGKNNIKTLYEIIAYCCLADYPINRIFCFIGGGMNGKSCFLTLLRKFIGNYNCCSTELDSLMTSRFEVTRLHKKLVCQMGETNFNEMSKTSILKKLTGGDLIGFEYKNKNPFEEKNYAKIIIATNNLPTTTDKTVGFYRRWMIIDFPNQFTEKKDILSEIPEEEYNNLATKCITILKELLEKREFTNEGTVEERTKKYEDHSDPLEKFIKEYVEEDSDGSIWKFEFEKRLNQWCESNKFRKLSDVSIGKKMKDKKIDNALRLADWFTDGQRKQFRAWIGIKWKESENNQDKQDKQVKYS